MASSDNRGFTIAEIALSVVIVGMFAATVIKGHEMIRNNRISAVMSQVKLYQSAVQSYASMRDGLPGDDPRATNRLKGCTPENHCTNGNGNGFIGVSADDYLHDNQAGNATLPAIETTMFWKHMVLAQVIKGVDVSSDPMMPVWTQTHPQCYGCGGFQVVQMKSSQKTPAGAYFMLRASPTGDPYPVRSGQGAVPPDWASRIDVKMDDGKPFQGLIHSGSADGLCTLGDAYNTATGDDNCIMIFRM